MAAACTEPLHGKFERNVSHGLGVSWILSCQGSLPLPFYVCFFSPLRLLFQSIKCFIFWKKRFESNGGELTAIDDENEVQNAEEAESEWLVADLKKQFWLARPMIFVNLLQFSVHLIPMMFVGYVGKQELAAAYIAISFETVTGLGVMIWDEPTFRRRFIFRNGLLTMGISSALETLCGQARGAKQYHLMGIQMQRVIVALNATCIPIACVWFGMSPILLALGQDPKISEYAGLYARWMLPSFFACMATLQSLVKFLQTQSVVLPMAVCSARTFCIHVPLCWLMILNPGVGYGGAAITIKISKSLFHGTQLFH